MLRRGVRAIVRKTRRWLEERPPEDEPSRDEQRDVRYPNVLFSRIVDEMNLSRYAHYIWGVIQGVRLAHVLGISRVSIIEFGVAGGNGLVALERIAIRVEAEYGVGIDVYGFDMGIGLPKPRDHRDLPNLFAEGDYPMNVEALRQRLRRAQLLLGPVSDTVVRFLQSGPAPVCFISNDLDLYSSTAESLRLLDGSPDCLLPRIHCYFDDILGLTYGDCNGERLAIAEFNAQHDMRKLSQIYGLRFFLPRQHADSPWAEKFYMAHLFDHEAYGQKDLAIERRRDLAV
jgi:hypothetical protein